MMDENNGESGNLSSLFITQIFSYIINIYNLSKLHSGFGWGKDTKLDISVVMSLTGLPLWNCIREHKFSAENARECVDMMEGQA